MNNEKFKEIVSGELIFCQKLLDYKGKEYTADNANRFLEFNFGAMTNGTTQEEHLRHLWAKHLFSVFQMIDELPILPSREKLTEKVTDNINYLLIYYSMMIERIDRAESIERGDRIC